MAKTRADGAVRSLDIFENICYKIHRCKEHATPFGGAVVVEFDSPVTGAHIPVIQELGDLGQIPSVHMTVRDRIRRAILRGEIPAGSRLLQADLAKQMRVSVTPVPKPCVISPPKVSLISTPLQGQSCTNPASKN